MWAGPLVGRVVVAESDALKVVRVCLIAWAFSPKSMSGCAGLMTPAAGQATKRRGIYWK